MRLITHLISHSIRSLHSSKSRSGISRRWHRKTTATTHWAFRELIILWRRRRESNQIMFRLGRGKPLCPAVTKIKPKSHLCYSNSSQTILTTASISPLLTIIIIAVSRQNNGPNSFNHINKCRKSQSLMILTNVPQAPAHLNEWKAEKVYSMTYRTILFGDKMEKMWMMSIMVMRKAS